MDGKTLDATTLEAARKRVYDTLSATLVGLETTEGRMLRDLTAKLVSADAAGGAAITDACRLYVGATRATEIDDIDIESCTTVGSVVIPLAITAAAPDQDGRSVLAAVVAGYDAMIRLGRAIAGASSLYRGIWPTYVCAACASAAVTARLRELDATQTFSALALALARANSLPRGAASGPGVRQYAVGSAAAEGYLATLAAASGFKGASDALADFGRRLDIAIDTDTLLDNLAASWLIHEVDTKLFPTSRQALASIEAFTELRSSGDAEGAAPADAVHIDHVDVYVPAAYRDMVDCPALPASRIESMLGVQYAMALAIRDREALYDVKRESLRHDADTERFMGKVTVHADTELSARFPQAWGSRVQIRQNDGRVATRTIMRPTGSAELTWSVLATKQQRIYAASGLGDPSAALLEASQALGADTAALGVLSSTLSRRAFPAAA